MHARRFKYLQYKSSDGGTADKQEPVGVAGVGDSTRERTPPPPHPPKPPLLVDKPLLLPKSLELTCTYRESLNKTSRTLVNMQCPTVAHALLAYKLLTVFSFLFFFLPPLPSHPPTSKFARKTNHALIKPTVNMEEIDTHMSKFT